VPAIVRARDDHSGEISLDLQISPQNLQLNLFGFQSGISVLAWEMQIPRYNTIKYIIMFKNTGRAVGETRGAAG
jgi:hypothetical protein